MLNTLKLMKIKLKQLKFTILMKKKNKKHNF